MPVSASGMAVESGHSPGREATPPPVTSNAQRFELKQGLCLALERGEFEFHFQPEVGLAGLDIKVVEALLRWRLPEVRARTRIPARASCAH